MGYSTVEMLTDKILQALPPGLQALSLDIRSLIKDAIKEQLLKLDLVPREEFDIQCQVLQRTTAKLAELEQVLHTLEKNLNGLVLKK